MPTPPFISIELLREARGILREQLQSTLDACRAIPVRQRSADDRLLIEKSDHDVGIYDTLLDYWEQGIFPTCVDGTWQMESRSRPGTVHHIWRDNRARCGWRCDCWQGERGGFHVHQAAMITIELALDLAERYDDEATPVAERADPATARQAIDEWLATMQLIEPDAAADAIDDPFLPPLPAERPAELRRAA